jgi:hypothetical protein
MSTYPPAAPVLTDPNLSASRFLQQPTWVAHRIQTLGDLRYVGNLLLSGRQETSGGAVGYETVEGIFADAPPETVAPGAEYTMTTIADGPGGLARVVKSGKDTLVTDEAIKRRNMDPVEKGLRKLVNSQGKAIDGSIISLIASAVTASAAAAAAWSATSGTLILRDILKAKASVTGQNLGYQPNVLLVDDMTGAYLGSDPVLSAAMAREDMSNPVYTGRFPVIAGLEIITVPTVNLPGGTAKAWVLDTTQLGFIATEDLGGGYQQAGDLVQSKVMRVDENDAWRLRARANFAPVVTDPLAGFAITGV